MIKLRLFQVVFGFGALIQMLDMHCIRINEEYLHPEPLMPLVIAFKENATPLNNASQTFLQVLGVDDIQVSKFVFLTKCDTFLHICLEAFFDYI